MKKNIQKWLFIATSWRVWYVILLVVLIQLYPVAVSDGQDSIVDFFFNEEFSDAIQDKYEVKGIDVSHHNSEIDWDTFANQKGPNRMQFCFMKATEGGDFIDTKFAEYWNEAQRLSIAKGAYHFYRPEVDPKIQAQNFINNVWLDEGDFAPVLDFEIQGRSRKHQRNLTRNVGIWLKIIEEHYGVKPIIYTNSFIYQKYIKGNFNDYPVWASQYETEKLEGFEGANLYFWQHSQTGRTKGVKGHVDLNVYLGNYFDLFALKVKRRTTLQYDEVPS